MPYKSLEDKRRHDRDDKRRRRGTTKKDDRAGTTFKDGIEYVPAFGRLPERPRFLVLSDEQVLDRANQPKADLTLWSGWRIEALRRCNEADKMRPLKGRVALKELKARFK